MAEVFLAKQEGLKGFVKLVVVKRILPHRAEDGEFVTMFLDEARTAADLRHPNVVNIFDINRNDGTYYMAMEFLHGHDVRAIMKQAAKYREQLPIEHTLEMIIGAASGLHYAHEKVGLDGRPLEIVHRDVSPQNIIVGFSGEVKIVDFGIAKAAHQVTETEAGIVKGKFAYMAPEQARGDAISHLADQFALGAVMWELLVLRRLFKRKSEHATMMAVLEDDVPPVRTFRPDLPRELAHIVDKTLERKPHKRFASCGELREALEDFLASKQVPHSQARLAEYMRELFDGTIEDEQMLSEELLEDGSLSAPSESARSLPPPDATRKDRKESAPAEASVGSMDPTRASPKRRTSLEPSEPKAEPVSIEDDDEEDDATAILPQKELYKEHAVERGRDKRDNKPKREGSGPGATARLAALALGVALLCGGLVFGGWRLLSGPAQGAIIVRTEPKGAVISVNGDRVPEVTPHILRLPAGKRVVIGVQKSGFATETRSVVVPTDKAPVEVIVRMKKK
jgi:serine/threonine-protein kinase